MTRQVDQEEGEVGEPTQGRADLEETNAGRSIRAPIFVLEFTIAKLAGAETSQVQGKSVERHASLRSSDGRRLRLSTLAHESKTYPMTLELDVAPDKSVAAHERLPFRVRLADGPQDVLRAVEIRSAAYSRHLPHVGEALREPEAEDFRSDVLLLIAERKLDRQVIGTLRLEPNTNGPLRVEAETVFPESFRNRRLVETSRLGVENGSTGTMVTVALVKAAFEICHACNIDHTISVGRRSMAEVFRSMCFDVLAGPLRMSFAKNVPLWIFCASVQDWQARLDAKDHAHATFIGRSKHPDIAIDYGKAFATFGRP